MSSHSGSNNRTRSSIGFYTARSRWGGYSQSERTIKVSIPASTARLRTRRVGTRPYATLCSAPAVLYEIYRPDNKALTLMLPVNTTVQDVISAAVKPGGDHVLLKMNSAGGQPLVTGASSSILPVQHDGKCLFFFNGLIPHRKSSAEAGRRWRLHGAGGQRETLHLHKQPSGETGEKRVFLRILDSKRSDVNKAFFSQCPVKEQQGPERGTADILGQMSSKDIATELTNYDWELFSTMHEVPDQSYHHSGSLIVVSLSWQRLAGGFFCQNTSSENSI